MPGRIAQEAAALRRRELSVVELVTSVLDDLERWEPSLHASVGDLREQALEEAAARQAELDRGLDRGVLHGIPVGIKDLVAMAGVPNTAASPILADNVPDRDAAVVTALRTAGAVPAVRTNTHQFAFGALTPPTRNPLDVDRMPGGSSGGSAALVGAGVLAAALGTDTAASVREPAALCGAVGLKTTRGRISLDGVVPLAWSLDTIGPLAVHPTDALAVFRAMAPRTAPQPLHAPPEGVAGLRVGVWREAMQRFGPGVREVQATTLQAMADAGARIHLVDLGEPDELVAAALVVLGAEALSYHRPWLDERRGDYAADVLAYLELSTSFTAEDLVGAQRLGTDFSRRLDEVLDDVDVLASPAQIVVPPHTDADEVELDDGTRGPRDLALIRTLAAFNLSGHPAISVPTGHEQLTGFPVSLQLVGPHGTEEALLRLAGEVQTACGYDHRAPEPPNQARPDPAADPVS